MKPEPENAIWVIGMERTGSTLVWNILRELGFHALKGHSYIDNGVPKIMTIRHPLDVICSLAYSLYHNDIIEYGDNVLETVLKQSFDGLFVKEHRDSDCLTFLEDETVSVIKYEDYMPVDSLEKMKDLIQKIVDITSYDKGRVDAQSFYDKYGLEAVKQFTAKFSDFQSWDKETLLHGKHVALDGKVGSWKDIMPEHLVKMYSIRLNYLMKRLGYA